jgi:hypothetical protein
MRDVTEAIRGLLDLPPGSCQLLAGIGQANAIATIDNPAPVDGNPRPGRHGALMSGPPSRLSFPAILFSLALEAAPASQPIVAAAEPVVAEFAGVARHRAGART